VRGYNLLSPHTLASHISFPRDSNHRLSGRLAEERKRVLQATARSRVRSPGRISARRRRRSGQSSRGVSGFLYIVEGGRPRHPHPHRCQIGIREVAITVVGSVYRFR